MSAPRSPSHSPSQDNYNFLTESWAWKRGRTGIAEMATSNRRRVTMVFWAAKLAMGMGMRCRAGGYLWLLVRVRKPTLPKFFKAEERSSVPGNTSPATPEHKDERRNVQSAKWGEGQSGGEEASIKVLCRGFFAVSCVSGVHSLGRSRLHVDLGRSRRDV
ncbi:hypothetical protein B0H19DRAFT_1232516 [Mycena capillaripes]|nr:hypothetical protein B0H19DRAFT_1232516 [Mycena capillaripes]